MDANCLRSTRFLLQPPVRGLDQLGPMQRCACLAMIALHHGLKVMPFFETGVEKMSQSNIRGKIHLLEETKTFGQKGFRKRLVVLEQDGGRFTNFIPVEFVQDACDQVDTLKIGDEIEVNYRLNGRRWQRDPSSEVKYFLSCEAISFRRLGDATHDETGFDQSNANNDLAEAGFDDGGDVPF